MTRRVVAVGVALALGAACSEEPEGPAPALVSDVDRLRLIVIEDPAPQVLAEVERVVDDRPVFAAQLLRTSGIPAARRQVAAVERVRVDTDEGRAIRGRLRAAYDARVSALQDYEAVLSAAASDEPALLEALHAQSRADQQLLAVLDELQAISPTAREEEDEDGSDAEESEAGDGPEPEPPPSR